MATLAPIRPGQFFRGKDTTLQFTVAGASMTGWALRWTLRRSLVESGPALVSRTTGAGVAVTAPTQATVAVLAASTAALLPGIYCHVFERTDPGSIMTLSYGWVVLES
jgi:hypothetical protein